VESGRGTNCIDQTPETANAVRWCDAALIPVHRAETPGGMTRVLPGSIRGLGLEGDSQVKNRGACPGVSCLSAAVSWPFPADSRGIRSRLPASTCLPFDAAREARGATEAGCPGRFRCVPSPVGTDGAAEHRRGGVVLSVPRRPGAPPGESLSGHPASRPTPASSPSSTPRDKFPEQYPPRQCGP
jgi:hypothetical protein